MNAKTLRNFIISGAKFTEFNLEDGTSFNIAIDKCNADISKYTIQFEKPKEIYIVYITMYDKNGNKLADVNTGCYLPIEQAYNTALNRMYDLIERKESYYRDMKEYMKYLLTEETNL